MEIILNDLPPEHELRNKPLAKIGAQYRYRNGGPWKPVLAPFKISRKTFNELGKAWTDNDEWKATKV